MVDLVRDHKKRQSVHINSFSNKGFESEIQALKGTTERLKFNRFRQNMGKI